MQVTAVSLLAVILRFNGEFAAPSKITMVIQFVLKYIILLPAIVMVSECIVVAGDRQLIVLLL